MVSEQPEASATLLRALSLGHATLAILNLCQSERGGPQDVTETVHVAPAWLSQTLETCTPGVRSLLHHWLAVTLGKSLFDSEPQWA